MDFTRAQAEGVMPIVRTPGNLADQLFKVVQETQIRHPTRLLQLRSVEYARQLRRVPVATPRNLARLPHHARGESGARPDEVLAQAVAVRLYLTGSGSRADDAPGGGHDGLRAFCQHVIAGLRRLPAHFRMPGRCGTCAACRCVWTGPGC